MSAQPQDNLIKIEIDGIEMQVPKGSMIIEAADKAGIDIPRFCYHRKLSIAANCRMCLVDVEKAPKPLPACATPVMDGMKVFTESRRAVDAQHGVMEFLLINHPLDCPICDQGGECELQDVAMGYGRSVSRFVERKRVVKDENIGSLVATDMTRCIHCTRCVRFLEEIAGTTELGGIGRGDRTHIQTFIGRSVDSEMSGNIIDLCPVGALTNKPFRFSARPWELIARASIAGYDCVGSHLWYHVRRGDVMRAVPRDNDAVNEAWLSDRDRYGHFGLKAEDRLERPMVKNGGEWQETDWHSALDAVVQALNQHKAQSGADQLGFLIAPQATTEEHYLLQKLARGLGSHNIDHRLRESDFSDQAALPKHPHLGLPITAINSAQAVLLVGSNIRHEQPILGARVRAAANKNQAAVMAINPIDYDFRFSLRHKEIVAPQRLAEQLGRVAKAAGASLAGKTDEWLRGLEVNDSARKMAAALKEAENAWIYLGDFSAMHPQASLIRALGQAIAEATGASVGVSTFANGVGAWLAGALPHRGVNGQAVDTAGLDASQQMARPRKAYVLHGFEPEWDNANPSATAAALAQAETVVALSAYASDSLRQHADIILPLAALQESAGTFHNIEGQAFRFSAAGKAPGEARPGWKILRMLGELLAVDGFSQRNLAAVQEELDEAVAGAATTASAQAVLNIQLEQAGLWRIGDVPMYAGDAVLRRSRPLQNTVHADNSACAMNPADAEKLGLNEGQAVRVSQGDSSTELVLQIMAEVPAGGVWVRSAVAENLALGAAIGPINVEGA